MTRKTDGKKGFLTRLLHNEAGNVLFMTAAFLIPLLGLVGGGVDMSRLYLAKTRLQQACDAGALAGRKAMANGTWTTGTGSTQARANNIFDGNFKSTGEYGSGAVTRTFTESGGVVTGTASVNMPMMVIKVLGITNKTLNIACTAKMEIPNTDVMFVIDNTGSMNCQVAHSGYSCPGGDNNGVEDTAAKMKGLRSAIKCFYEALTKVNTSEPCTYSGGTWSSTNDPTATTYSGTAQLRFGFMPYSVNVNVGKLLPNSFFADSWYYQSRTYASTPTQVWTWVAASPGSITPGGWGANPSSLTVDTTYSGWGNISGSGSVTINGVSRVKTATAANSSACNALNTMGTNMLDYTYQSNSQSSWSQTGSSTPSHPDVNQTINYSQTDNRSATGYRYKWSTSGSGSCRLQRSNSYNYSVSQSGTANAPLTWTPYQQVTGWDYNKILHNISGLKAGSSTWNSSVTLPLGARVTVKLSGSNSASTIVVAQDVSVPWDGCIEERQTHLNTNSSTITTTDWNPIPSTAYDTDFNLVPSSGTAGSQWAPILPNAVWARYTGTSTDSYAPILNTTSDLSRNYSYSCPTEAKKLQEWTSSNLVTYLSSLVATGNTYHDIGMVWGARFISPTGIFASENAATPSGQPIQRHIVFMTDGDTMTRTDNYSAYGVTWWDRRQTSYAPSSTNTDNIVNARLTALCTAIKNQNITLWVVSYGGGVNSTTETRLQNCATTPNAPGVANTHYFSASDTPTLIAKFQQIAAEIADLRLIS